MGESNRAPKNVIEKMTKNGFSYAGIQGSKYFFNSGEATMEIDLGQGGGLVTLRASSALDYEMPGLLMSVTFLLRA